MIISELFENVDFIYSTCNNQTTDLDKQLISRTIAESGYDNILSDIIRKVKARGLQLSTMESCTSGLVASTITDTEGSSSVFQKGYVTYSNQAKIDVGVPPTVMEDYGVYSKETAIEMARTLVRNQAGSIGIGVTGNFSNIDPANPEGVPGEVNAAICWDNISCHIYIKLKPEADLDRHTQKEIITAIVLTTLYYVIELIHVKKKVSPF